MIDQHPKQQAAFALMKSYDGLREIPGDKDEPKIVQMFADVGHSWVKDDETAWCAAAVGATLERSGLPSTRKLNARSYLDWGITVDPKAAKPGDVVVFWRGTPTSATGHVAYFERRDGAFVWVWGGNQRDQICLAKYPAARVIGVRRWPDDTAKPAAPAPKPAAPKEKTTPSASVITMLINWLLSLFGRK